ALARDPAPVEDDQFLGDLADGGPHAGLGALPFGAPEAVQCRRLTAGVVAHGVDLIGRHVELVAALVLEQEVVAFGAADGAFHHAAVASRAVLVVHDVVAGLQVLEEALGVGAARTRTPVGTPATGDDPRGSTAGGCGLSGTGVTDQAGTSVWDSRRSKGTCRRGNSRSAGAPHVWASDWARSASSARTSAARSRMRRGSIRST